jgi:hypothetical protein
MTALDIRINQMINSLEPEFRIPVEFPTRTLSTGLGYARSARARHS